MRKWVKCIEPKGADTNFDLEAKVYEVQCSVGKTYQLVGQGRWAYSKSRFVEVPSPTPLVIKDEMQNAYKASATTTPAVNDHVCQSCACDRVSRAESKCWRCGNTL